MAEAVIYARVSSPGQAEEELPIESQIQRCREKAAALGVHVAREYVDAGVSARTDDRPQFRACVDYCEAYQPAYLVTWSTSRFARNKLDAALYKVRLARARVNLVYVSMDIDRSTDAGWMVEGMLELYDEFTSRQISADTRRSMISNARAGRWNGGVPPYGYRPVPDGRRRRLELADAEAQVARRIYAMRLEGMGAKTIAAVLNDAGLTNRDRRWTRSSVGALLRNEALTGRIVFGRKDRSAARVRPREDWIVVDSHEPVIDPATWAAVQRILDAETPQQDRAGSPKSNWIFTGLLRCARCGASLQIETAKGRSQRYSYYNCRSAQRLGQCENRRMPAPSLERWLLAVLAEKIFDRTCLAAIVDELRRTADTDAEKLAADKTATVGRIQELRRRLDRIYEVIEAAGLAAPDLDDLTARMRRYNTELRTLQNHLVDMERPRVEVVMRDTGIEDLQRAITGLIESDANPAKIRHFFSAFVDRIEVGPDNIQVIYSPARLIGHGADKAVHSRRDWLPGAGALGTVRGVILVELPAQLKRRAA